MVASVSEMADRVGRGGVDDVVDHVEDHGGSRCPPRPGAGREELGRAQDEERPGEVTQAEEERERSSAPSLSAVLEQRFHLAPEERDRSQLVVHRGFTLGAALPGAREGALGNRRVLDRIQRILVGRNENRHLLEMKVVLPDDAVVTCEYAFDKENEVHAFADGVRKESPSIRG